MFFFPETGALNNRCDLAGYDSIYFSLSLGTVYFIALAYLLLIVMIGSMDCILKASKSKCQTIMKRLHGLLFWNSIIMFAVETFFEILIALAINLQKPEYSFGEYAVKGVVQSNTLFVLFAIVSIGLPLFICIFYYKNRQRWDDEDFNKIYGAPLEDLDTNPHPKKKGYDKHIVILSPIILILRRLIFVIGVMWFPNFLVLHFFLLFNFTTLQIVFLLSFWPYKESKTTKVEVWNEIACYFLLYQMLCFTDLVKDANL